MLNLEPVFVTGADRSGTSLMFALLASHPNISLVRRTNMWRWLRSARVAQRNLEKYPDNYRVVRYETLAQQPEETIQKVCAFVGEPYEPEMLAMRGAPDHGAIGGNSSFTKFKPGTISTRSIGRFRKVLNQPDVAFLQTCVGRMMQTFNYALEPLDLSLADRSRFYAVNLPVNLVRMAGWLALNEFKNLRGSGVPNHRLKSSVDY